MFKAARHAKIKEILLEQTQIDVLTLSSLLGVSVVTIRSDLEELENEGFIVRSHGGAILNNSFKEQAETSATKLFPSIANSKEKEYIAQIAEHLVEDNEWIFLGPGSTCFSIAKALLVRNQLNVITNNLHVAAALAQNNSSNVIVTGGNLDHSGMFTIGDIFENALRSINISKAFISVDGVDRKGGFTVSSTQRANIYKKIRAITKEMIFVADYTKFEKISFMKIADITDVDTVISNEKIPESYKEFFFNNGIKIFTSYKISPASVD